MEGKSLLPLFQNNPFQRESPIFFEHQGNRGARQGKWKLVALKGKPWELYDMQADRSELNNLAAQMPEKVKTMGALYQDWAKRCFVTKEKKDNRSPR